MPKGRGSPGPVVMKRWQIVLGQIVLLNMKTEGGVTASIVYGRMKLFLIS